jgi:hypothetical protein
MQLTSAHSNGPSRAAVIGSTPVQLILGSIVVRMLAERSSTIMKSGIVLPAVRTFFSQGMLTTVVVPIVPPPPVVTGGIVG